MYTAAHIIKVLFDNDLTVRKDLSEALDIFQVNATKTNIIGRVYSQLPVWYKTACSPLFGKFADSNDKSSKLVVNMFSPFVLFM